MEKKESDLPINFDSINASWVVLADGLLYSVGSDFLHLYNGGFLG